MGFLCEHGENVLLRCIADVQLCCFLRIARPLAALRYVFDTIGLYTHSMTHSLTALPGTPAIHTAFILRLSWDSSAQQWCILVKPTAGDDCRLFGDMEAAFLHVEMRMAERVQRLGMSTTGACCIPGEQIQEIER
jgi:hypothetical protein